MLLEFEVLILILEPRLCWEVWTIEIIGSKSYCMRNLGCLFFLLLLIGCNNGLDQGEYNPKGYGVNLVIPQFKNGHTKLEMDEIKELTSLLEIYPIIKGYDSIQYRFWIGDDDACRQKLVMDEGYLLIISKYKNSPWKAILISYGIKYNDGKPFFACKNIKNIQPKNWDLLVAKLKELEVSNWLGSAVIPRENYQVGNTLNPITIEISTTQEYRFISHISPSGMTCPEKECKQLDTLIYTFSEQFEAADFRKYLRSQTPL